MKFCNIDFNIKKKEELFISDNSIKCIVTANAQLIYFANTIERYLNFMNNNYVTFDGTVPLKMAKKRNKEFKKFEKLSGSEIVYDFCEYAKKNNLRVFFLGGKKESNEKAVDVIADRYNIKINGYSPDFEQYPFSNKFLETCYKKLEEFRPDIVFVGFGSPKQEFFIEDSKDFFNSIGIKYVVGSGGTFEFVSGAIKRAPKLIQKVGLEGMYRLLKEPNMMRLKRIFQSFKFFYYINHYPNFDKDK